MRTQASLTTVPASMMTRAAALGTRERDKMPTVLVIEDEANIRQFVSVNLEARGYDILQAASAEEGLLQLRDHTPGALILDIKLPTMSGWDMLKVIADDPALPKIPVIILSAFLLTSNHSERIYPNIVALLNKPVSTSDLILAVRKAFG